MSGYEPMDELSSTLESLAPSPKRRITVPPPRSDDMPAAKPQRTTPTKSEARTDPPPSAFSLPTRRRGTGLATRRPNGPMKSITASLPEHLVERVTALRLDADVDGTSFKLTELLSAALLELPLKPSAVAALVDRYSSQFNYELTSRDDGFVDEKRLSTQITPDAARRVAAVVRAVYQEYGIRLLNKDLYALALLSLLADRD